MKMSSPLFQRKEGEESLQIDIGFSGPKPNYFASTDIKIFAQ